MRAGVRQYSPNEVARALNLHPRTVQREVNRGNLEAIRSPSGHFINVTEAALEKWLAGNQGKTVLARALQWKRRRKNRKQTAPHGDSIHHDTDALVTDDTTEQPSRLRGRKDRR